MTGAFARFGRSIAANTFPDALITGNRCLRGGVYPLGQWNAEVGLRYGTQSGWHLVPQDFVKWWLNLKTASVSYTFGNATSSSDTLDNGVPAGGTEAETRKKILFGRAFWDTLYVTDGWGSGDYEAPVEGDWWVTASLEVSFSPRHAAWKGDYWYCPLSVAYEQVQEEYTSGVWTLVATKSHRTFDISLDGIGSIPSPSAQVLWFGHGVLMNTPTTTGSAVAPWGSDLELDCTEDTFFTAELDPL